MTFVIINIDHHYVRDATFQASLRRCFSRAYGAKTQSRGGSAPIPTSIFFAFHGIGSDESRSHVEWLLNPVRNHFPGFDTLFPVVGMEEIPEVSLVASLFLLSILMEFGTYIYVYFVCVFFF